MGESIFDVFALTDRVKAEPLAAPAPPVGKPLIHLLVNAQGVLIMTRTEVFGLILGAKHKKGLMWADIAKKFVTVQPPPFCYPV